MLRELGVKGVKVVDVESLEDSYLATRPYVAPSIYIRLIRTMPRSAFIEDLY